MPRPCSTTANFIQQATTIHEGVYDYSQVVYTKGSSKIKILCKKHGVFEQMPLVHLRGVGCRECCLDRKRKSLLNLLKDFAKVHQDRYGYDLVNCTLARQKVKIQCQLHGVFEQNIGSHLRGNGCPKCADQEKVGGISADYFLSDPSRKGQPGILYLSLVQDKKHLQDFIKVGITTRNVVSRFKTEPTTRLLSYKAYELPLFNAFLIEQQILETFLTDRFYPNIKFNGRTECFHKNMFPLLNNHIQQLAATFLNK